jgi:hypothetical protein
MKNKQRICVFVRPGLTAFEALHLANEVVFTALEALHLTRRPPAALCGCREESGVGVCMGVGVGISREVATWHT